MASACINNIAMSPENFLDAPVSYKSYGWLSPRSISITREMSNDDSPPSTGLKKPPPPAKILADPPKETDLEVRDLSASEFGGFEFTRENPADMLTADELFSDGKLVPLHLSIMRPPVVSSASPGIRSPVDTPKSSLRMDILGNDPYPFSPKAPRCSSRWKELLGLRKLYQNSNAKQDNQKLTPSVPSQSSNSTKSIRHFLHRSSKSSDSSLNLALLKEMDSESISIPSRMSLSSSSSGHDYDDLPRLSLDSDKPAKFSVNNSNPPRLRLVKQRTASTDNGPRVGRSPMRRPAETTAANSRGVSIDSPRMNSSGKIIYQSLERSSSSPSSFNGGPRLKHRGMERSYSANVRVTPVLNVPVCSLMGSSKSGGVFGFPIFSSQQKREGAAGGGVGSSINGSNGGTNRSQQSNGKNRTDRRQSW